MDEYMTTITSTKAEFDRDFCKFHAAIGVKSHSQKQIAGGHKALTLRYLGLSDVTDDELDHCAMILQIATRGAIARGWNLHQKE